VEAGAYEVEAVEGWLRLIPKGGERSDAVLLAASRSPHRSEVTAPEVMSIQGGEDVAYLWLLLPDGQSWTAKGSYSGVRTRGAVGMEVRLHGLYQYTGSIRKTVDAPFSLGACLMEAETGYAPAFTWDSESKTCTILDSVTEMIPNPNYVSGTSIEPFFRMVNEYGEYKPPHEVADMPWDWQRSGVIYPEFNKILGGERYQFHRGAGLQQCQVWCAQDPNCGGFALVKSNNNCYFRREGQVGALAGNDNYISGRKINYQAGVKLRNWESILYYTSLNLPRCIGAALYGTSEVRFLPLFGSQWHCKPGKFLLVNDPQFKNNLIHHRNPTLYGGGDYLLWR